MQSDYLKYMSNPKSFTVKKWILDLLKEDFPKHEEIVERISTSLLTDKDVEDFGKLISKVYETAYRKCVDDYKKEFEKLGVKISINVES